MSERDAFECAIRERPDDVTLRLVYADWLDERGEADEAAIVRDTADSGMAVDLFRSSFRLGAEVMRRFNDRLKQVFRDVTVSLRPAVEDAPSSRTHRPGCRASLLTTTVRPPRESRAGRRKRK